MIWQIEEHNKGTFWVSHAVLSPLWSKAWCVSLTNQYCLHANTARRALATPVTLGCYVWLVWDFWILVSSPSNSLSQNILLGRKKRDTLLQTHYPAVKVSQLLPCQLHGLNSADAPQLSFHIMTSHSASCLTNKIKRQTGVEGEAEGCFMTIINGGKLR